MRHFLLETDFQPGEHAELFALAASLKKNRGGNPPFPLAGQSWGMLFYKSSTRTRISFQVGIHELGGQPLMIDVATSQIGRGEPPEDTARIFSRYLHGVVIRCYEHAILESFASAGSIPVVNALSDFNHPCQLYADLFTLAEARGGDSAQPLEALKGKKVVYYGDTACNMANSWVMTAGLFGMNLVLSGPDSYQPHPDAVRIANDNGYGGSWRFEADPSAAAADADVVYTDTWASMGKEDEKPDREHIMAPYQVNAGIMDQAGSGAVFMHCLPAYAGHEVTAEVLDSPRSIIWDQAENRLHMQKAILSVLASTEG